MNSFLSVTHDNVITSMGVAALLRHIASVGCLTARHVHVVTCGLPHSASQYHRLSQAILDTSRVVIVVESLPLRASRALIRIKGNRVFYLNAGASLHDMTWALEVICQQLSNTLPTKSLSLSMLPPISLKEHFVLCHLLNGESGETIARIEGCTVKSISSRKRSMMKKMNVQSLAELHFRLSLERHHLGISEYTIHTLISDEVR
ncbi:helix-turn-helix transcriptional regulator [Edwardsiella anguillarum]|uniref:helix-turn-helix transcriptional regulator n=1 Tax=Edwardsiella anguillarum TaxID=1821960 RepID=UPI0024B82D55|nr:LuxR C-terminal-related transcriptional regulator [Edwardsiella anguillarum]WHP81289.1 LuxR family transcriptional regulator [Edwardsiella anguillarum]WHQ18790.1 LuxR family transcriptional regulator [Edwardsiella anguillarum]WHQ22332.1 LuxR family transcriptional regulator [Edwardsiella anguillarum]WHQ25854.1 LuxR family transcriptional regulator [Edwardsiella anguillarum]WHQ29377.1 LuxR family transcriptional regulator [Edwardsiella anguillarum]